MRRLIILAMAVGLLMTVAVGTATAEPAEKAEICHVNGVSDAIPTFNPTTDLRMFYPGMLIDVTAAAVPAHVGHGDSATMGKGDGQYRTDAGGLASIRLSADNNGLTVWEHADCFITRLPAS
jgi:hypothetical protein